MQEPPGYVAGGSYLRYKFIRIFLFIELGIDKVFYF